MDNVPDPAADPLGWLRAQINASSDPALAAAVAARARSLGESNPTWSLGRCWKTAAWTILNPDWPPPDELADDALDWVPGPPPPAVRKEAG